VQEESSSQSPQETHKVLLNGYFILVALYFLLGAANVANALINLTTGSHVGFYLEFINPFIDRILTYALAFITLTYATARSKSRRQLFLLILLHTFVLFGYAASSQTTDVIVMLTTATMLVWFLTNPAVFGANRSRNIYTILVYSMLIIIIIELLSLVSWLIFPLFPSQSQGGFFRSIVDLETKTFLLFGSFAPLLTIAFLFSWIPKILANQSIFRKLSVHIKQAQDNLNPIDIKPRTCLLLACSIFLSLLVAFYPYMPTLNADMHPIGVDIPAYGKWITEIGNGNPLNFLGKAFLKVPDRPFTLLAIYIVKQASGLSALDASQFLILFLAPALVLAIYFFARETTSSTNIRHFSVFLTISSFHIAVGMYGGFLSNWMAIIQSYLFMGLYFSSLRSKSRLKAILTFPLSLSMLFTHGGAWGMTIGILAVYLLLTILKRQTRTNSFEIKLLIAIISINIVAGILRNYALGWSAGGFETLRQAQVALKPTSLASFWDDTLLTFLHTMYGFFINPLTILLAFIGALIIVHDDSPLNRYLTSWLISSSIFFVLTPSWEIKSRILFNIPLPIFEAIGLIGLTSLIQKHLKSDKTPLINRLTASLILLITLNYAFRCAFAMSQVIYDLFP